jgi:hypothetical protein
MLSNHTTYVSKSNRNTWTCLKDLKFDDGWYRFFLPAYFDFERLMLGLGTSIMSGYKKKTAA